MAKQTKRTELPLGNATKIYLKHYLTCLTVLKSRWDWKNTTFVLWNWSFPYYNLSERLSLPCTLLFCLHKENEQVKCKRDKLAPAKQSRTSHLNFPAIVWVVMNHTPQYLHQNHNKQDPDLITVCSSSPTNTTQTGRPNTGLFTNISTYFNLCFCYAEV